MKPLPNRRGFLCTKLRKSVSKNNLVPSANNKKFVSKCVFSGQDKKNLKKLHV